MDKVVLDGVEYVKATVAAKQFKYTADYVGQLCRNKKVDARLVGRIWFVNPESLTKHKKGKYKSSKNDTSNKVAIDIEEELPVKVFVNSAVKNKTIKSLNKSKVSHNTATKRRLKVSYELDDENLMPTLIKKVVQPPKFIRVVPAGAKKIKIRTKKSESSFLPEELPEVALSGELTVEGLTGQDEIELNSDVDNKTNIIATSPGREEKSTPLDELVGAKKELTTEHNDTKIKFSHGKKVKINKHTEVASISNSKIPVNKKLISKELKFTPSLVEKVVPSKISTTAMMSPLIATVLALIVVVGIFSASTNVIVSKNNYQSNTVLQLKNLLEILHE